MSHPLSDQVLKLDDKDLYEKYTELTRKYFMTTNSAVLNQMQMLLDDIRMELERRKSTKKPNEDIDNLIKVV